VSFDESRGVYHCHGGGCDFSGGAVRLARELGLTQQLSGAEYRELRQNQARADRAARALYERVKARRFEVLDGLHTLNRLEVRGHETGPDNAATWHALAQVYGRRPALLVELTILENCGAADLIRFLSVPTATREAVISRVLAAGGLFDVDGKFLCLEV
jgi:hypothetical protein